MSKYIKWELINEFKSKTLMFGVIIAIYLLAAILTPGDGVFVGLIFLAFGIIIIASSFLTFFYGANRTMDSYKKQTFLLESMIPLSPKKILLAKYILAILFNLLFCIIFVFGVSILLLKADIDILQILSNLILHSSFEQKTAIMKLFLLTISSTISFTSLVSLVFITLKSFFPNGKAQKIISYILCFFIQYLISYLSFKIIGNSSNSNILYSIIMLVFSVVYFFGSAWLIENKLEVYN